MTTDTSERGLESLIVRSMTGRVDLLSPPYVPSETSTPVAGGTGWLLGDPKHYDRGACVDLVQLRGFVMAKIFGGYGYMRDYPVEKLMRDAKATEVLCTRNEDLRVDIAAGLYDS
jgi:hypothetical protein